MTYDMCRLVFISAAIASAVLFVLSIALFFVLKIPKVIGDLNGSTARKAIQDIREKNEMSGDKRHQVSAVNRNRGRLTDEISKSGRLRVRRAAPFATGVVTDQLDVTEEILSESPVPIGQTTSETTVLSGQAAGETIVLDTQPIGETTVLSEQTAGETTALNVQQSTRATIEDTKFSVEFEITYIHTNEMIS